MKTNKIGDENMLFVAENEHPASELSKNLKWELK